MKFEDLYNFPKVPGIYYFRNTENGKYYIGQAQEIRERVLKHKTNFESGYYPDAHLYRAWRKHGIDIFEAGIIEIVDLEKGDGRNKLLDELEKKYIEQYNSYGTGGYNQTRGGDGGIDGYKFTELQKNRVRINSLLKSMDGRNKIYFYDTIKEQYGEALSFQIILDALNKFGNRYVKRQICYFGRYIFSRSQKNLKKKIQKFFSDEYFYSNTDCIDTTTDNFQNEIDNITRKYQKEIDDFFTKYGKSKYNRKDNKTKKEALRKLQKADLDAGMTKEDYIEKYHVCANTYYEHLRKLCPNRAPVHKENSSNVKHPYISTIQLTEEMKQDILAGMRQGEFIKKYKVSESSFQRYRNKIEEEYNIRIRSVYCPNKKKLVSEEQEKDILNGMNAVEYMKKYNLGETTYYRHRQYIAKQYPDYKFKRNHNYKPKIDINLIQEDILNGISKREFCLKYNLSETCYKKYKKKILKENEQLV